MRQYNQFKAKHPDAILLFRVGDFYETYGEDAVKSSKILGITLTRHGKGASQTELAGFPHHALDTYLPRLVRAGYRVAICEQLEDPKLTKTLVKRGIIELVTPGVSINDKVLEQRENNFLAAIHLTEKQSGIAFLDISTGEFYIAEGNYEYLDKLFQNFKPMELVIQKGKTQAFKQNFGEKMLLTQLDDWVFKTDYTRELLTKHFHTKSLKGFGVEDLPLGIIAAGAALHYIYETQNHKIQHITKISRIEEDLYVWLDKFTIRNLELIHSSNENAVTLLDVLDETQTPMGSRMLRKWILMPLKEKSLIDKRLSVVEYLINNQDFTCQLTDILKQMEQDRVPRLVVGSDALLLLRDDAAVFLRSDPDPDERLLDVLLLQEDSLLLRGQDRCLIHQILQVCPGKSRRRAGHRAKIHVIRQGLLSGMYLENLQPASDIGAADMHLPVESSRSENRGVQNVDPVGRRHHDNALVLREPVHLHKKLVERLLSLIMAAAHAGASAAPDCVYLIDEDNAGLILLRFLEQVAHTAGSDTDKHFHEVRTRDGEKRYPRLSGNRSGHQRFTRPGRADQQNPLRDSRTYVQEPFRTREKLDNLLQLLLLLLQSGDIRERNLLRVRREHPRAALAEIHHHGSAALLPIHHHKQEKHHEPGKKHRKESRKQSAASGNILHPDRHIICAHHRHCLIHIRDIQRQLIVLRRRDL